MMDEAQEGIMALEQDYNSRCCARDGCTYECCDVFSKVNQGIVSLDELRAEEALPLTLCLQRQLETILAKLEDNMRIIEDELIVLKAQKDELNELRSRDTCRRP